MNPTGKSKKPKREDPGLTVEMFLLDQQFKAASEHTEFDKLKRPFRSDDFDYKRISYYEDYHPPDTYSIIKRNITKAR